MSNRRIVHNVEVVETLSYINVLTLNITIVKQTLNGFKEIAVHYIVGAAIRHP